MLWKKLLKLHNVATKCSYGYTKCSYGHTKLETPVPVRTLKLGDLGHGQGLEGVGPCSEKRGAAAAATTQQEMWWRIGTVVLQTSEAVVPGSNPASLTVENSEDRQSHCVLYTVKSRGREGDLNP